MNIILKILGQTIERACYVPAGTFLDWNNAENIDLPNLKTMNTVYKESHYTAFIMKVYIEEMSIHSNPRIADKCPWSS